ncbi:MAG: 50S ribosomal protein L21 [Betaproteobacteria bacterium AqS2]|uniref:Large ribosomal subunit protein bL21 n=1 Tax=Candidatus Amphirhobacter heronislandensis TaxID=1732024 RepID=A0A930Y2H8_9GAMM|nr:50S ribosomal protein L21 [Betaproteobacteria bacterium AqS2]
MKATIRTSGTQLRLQVGDVVTVDRIETAPGDTVVYDRVLLLEDGEAVTVGQPTVPKAQVSAEVIEHFRGPKVRVFKLRRRKNSRRVRGHRSELSRIRVTEIKGA